MASTEDDRAAKAARAKALLKKRQAKKAGAGPSALDSPTRSGSPALSDAPPPPGPAEKTDGDVADLFSASDGANTDSSWLHALERVDSPSHTPPAAPLPHRSHSPNPIYGRPHSPSPLVPHVNGGTPPVQTVTSPPPRSFSPSVKSPLSPPLVNGSADIHTHVQQLQQTVDKLTSENTSLAASLERLRSLEASQAATQSSLNSERTRVQELERSISILTGERDHLRQSLAQLQEIESTNRRMEVNLQEEQRKGHDLQKIVDSLSAENAELQGASARLAQLEPMLQKAGNLLREEQSRSAGLRQQVSDLETRLQDIPKQLQTIAALEAEKQSLETGLTQQLLAAEARAQSMEESLADERSKSRALQERLSDLETSVRDASALQETIAILVSEKSSLSTQLERLQDTEARAQEVQNLLDQERQKSQALEGRIREMEIEASTSSAEITRLTSNEKELSERCREQERELQRTQAALSGLQAASSESSRRVRELEDQIQNDDTAERLEASLKNTQDRADELEFQLSKLKQAHDALKADREALEAKLRQHSITAEDWIKKHDSLEERNATIQKQLDDITFERDALLQDKAALQTEVDAGHKSAEDVQKLLAQATSDLSASARQLQTAQAELRAALRRAEEAERIQKDLQAEGTQLLRSLDEMRPKVVELSNEKAELMEKADGLDAALKSRDAVIAQLEASLTEAQQQRDETEKRRRSIVATHEKEHASSLQAMSELQKAYTELQTDAEQAYSMVRDFEAQRRNDQQSMARHVEDVDRLTRTVAELEKQLAALQIDLAERGRASEEQQDFLGRTQTEIEFLRGEIAARDDEIEKLRQQQNSDASPTTRKSWNEEMLSATRQQLDLELSASQSRIRELESAVFEAEDRAHGLQKQVNSLQDQLAHSILVHARSASQEGRRPFSPTFAATGPSRPSSRLNHTESRRPSLNMARRSSGTLAPPPRSALDYNMSPETRHKRQVSLNMLKARMDSEAAAASRPGPRAMPPIPAGKSGHALSSVTEADPEQQHSFRKPQFTNESFFWCSSCSGDLLIL